LRKPSPADPARPPLGPVRRALARLDALFDRLYGWRYNPLYQSGTIAVLLLLVLLATGLYLLLFYRIGAPYDSVVRIDAQWWGGRWIRSLHRYASDAAVVAVAVHAARMFLRGRSWGPRALAWLTGLALTGFLLFIGLTGFVMVWDVQGRFLAMEGARILDALPIFSEPVSRAFIGERPMPGAFFFLNYFLHIALPLGMALFLYLHVSRIARPSLLPSKGLAWGVVGVLSLLAVAWPAALPPAADPGALPHQVPVDWFFGFWLPATLPLPAGWVWGVGAAVLAGLLAVPRWSRPPREALPEPSEVDPRSCTGCEQCFHDCPYDAIAMVPRTDGRDTLLAFVDPALCVSCGICAGSCAPMGIGPPGRSGKDQLARVKAFVAERRPGEREVVLVACSHGAGEVEGMGEFAGAQVYTESCIGNVHTSVVEYLVRAGAGGVFIAGCPPRDCWNREGPKWTGERLFHDREAELKERVDRRRIRFRGVGAAERRELARALAEFREEILALIPPPVEEDIQVEAICTVPEHTPEELAEGLRP